MVALELALPVTKPEALDLLFTPAIGVILRQPLILYITLHYITLHDRTGHDTTLHYITLHYITLHTAIRLET